MIKLSLIFSLTIMIWFSAMNKKEKVLCFFKNRNGTFIRIPLQHKTKELFFNNVAKFFTQIILTNILHVDGIFIVVRMQPSASISVLNDKKMTVHHCYLQVDCGSFFIFKMQIIHPLNLLHKLNSIYQGFGGFEFCFCFQLWETSEEGITIYE